MQEKEKAHALVTGENLGQVASQTLDNLAVEDDVVDIPVLRPLLSFDKNEAIDIAKKSEYILGFNSTRILLQIHSKIPRNSC